MVKDATLQEVTIGQKYGYTNLQNGHLEIVIGEAININEESKKVLLDKIMIRSGLSGEIPEEWKTTTTTWSRDAKKENIPHRKRTVYASRLFPIFTKELVLLNMM